MDERQLIEFHLDPRSGMPPYLQLVRQVKHALLLNLLRPGDQLPTVRQVVAHLAINPNTVLKAYRELEYEGLVGGRPGQGTFILETAQRPTLTDHRELREELDHWLRRAADAGLDEETIVALFTIALRNAKEAGAA